MPQNFKFVSVKEELVHTSTVPTVRKLWAVNNIKETPLEKSGEKIRCGAEKAFEWIGPTVFASPLLFSQNPYLITIVLNVISNYLTTWFRGVPSNQRIVKLSIIIETRSGVYKELKYEGSPDGLDKLPKAIKEVYNEE